MSAELHDNYRPHKWAVYELGLDAGSPPTQKVSTPYQECGMGSKVAEDMLKAGDPEQRRFYFDYEQLEAGLEPAGTSGLEELAEPWNNHPVGSLVMATFQRIREVPPVMTYLVEVKEDAPQA